MRKRAYICSPYRANTPAGVKKHKEYARQLVRWAIVHGYAPICPHLYLTEVLNDHDEAERAAGLNIGLELLAACDVIIVGEKYGISEGMITEIKQAQRIGLTLHEVFKIS